MAWRGVVMWSQRQSEQVQQACPVAPARHKPAWLLRNFWRRYLVDMRGGAWRAVSCRVEARHRSSSTGARHKSVLLILSPYCIQCGSYDNFGHIPRFPMDPHQCSVIPAAYDSAPRSPQLTERRAGRLPARQPTALPSVQVGNTGRVLFQPR